MSTYGLITFRASRSSWTKSKQHQSLGYPHDLNTSSEQREVMTGGGFDQIECSIETRQIKKGNGCCRITPEWSESGNWDRADVLGEAVTPLRRRLQNARRETD